MAIPLWDLIPPLQKRARSVEAHQRRSSYRRRANSDPYTSKSLTTLPRQWAVISRDHFQRVKDFFNENHLDTRCITMDRFPWITPQVTHSENLRRIYETFLTNPMLVRDNDLHKIMKLRASTIGSKVEKEIASCYIRSYCLKKSKFRDLVDEMKKTIVPRKMRSSWNQLLQNANIPDNTMITIRYVGSARGTNTPLRRHQGDTLDPNGVHAAFRAAVAKLDNPLRKRVNVWYVEDSSVRYFEGKTKATSESNAKDTKRFIKEVVTDEYEQFLIALFQPDSLLNTDIGGTQTLFPISTEDSALFQELGTTVISDFTSLREPLTNELHSRLEDHFRDIQSYAIEKLDDIDSGTPKTAFSDLFRERIQSAASPMLVNGYVVAAFAGRDTPFNDRINDRSFYESSERTASVIRRFFSRLEHLERSRNVTNCSTYQPQDLSDTVFCWANVMYWNWKESLPIAIGQFQKYLEILKPLVVVSYGMNATNVILFGYSSSRIKSDNHIGFTPEMGVPRLASWRSRQAKDLPEDFSDVFILIPQGHPGVDNHGRTNYIVQRGWLLTYYIAFVHLHWAIRLASADQVLGRRELCKQIMENANRSLLRLGIYNILDQIKPKIASVLGNSNYIEPTSSSTISNDGMINNEDLSQAIQEAGQAHNSPNSKARQKAVELIWQLDLPLFRTFQKKEWTSRMCEIPDGSFFAAATLSLSDELSLDLGIDMERFDTGTSQLATLNNYCAHYATKFHGQYKLNAKWREYLPLEKINGTNITVTKTKSAIIRWDDSTNDETVPTNVCIDVPNAAISHGLEGNERTVWFHARGVDVRGPKSNTYYFSKGADLHSPHATVELKHFLRMSNASTQVKLPRLWSLITGLDFQTELQKMSSKVRKSVATEQSAVEGRKPENEVYDFRSKKLGGRGEGFFRLEGNIQGTQQNWPLLQNDALWLLEVFLEAVRPKGGTFWLVDLDEWPESDSMAQQFISFIQQPEYNKHGHRVSWEAALNLQIDHGPEHGVDMYACINYMREDVHWQTFTRNGQSVQYLSFCGPRTVTSSDEKEVPKTSNAKGKKRKFSRLSGSDEVTNQ